MMKMEEIQLRYAELKDLEKILALYLSALEPASNKAEEEFLREKIRLHLLHPSSHVLTAWVNERLAGFFIYVGNERMFTRYIKSPGILLRTLGRMLLGFYGLNPLNILRLFKRFLDRARTTTKTPQGEEICLPNAYIPAFAVASEYRGRGIGSLMMRKALEHLKSIGVEEVGSFVHLDNEISLHMHEKLGFTRHAMVWRFNEPLILLIKKLDEDAEH